MEQQYQISDAPTMISDSGIKPLFEFSHEAVEKYDSANSWEHNSSDSKAKSPTYNTKLQTVSSPSNSCSLSLEGARVCFPAEVSLRAGLPNNNMMTMATYVVMCVATVP